jgi:hypothetical protein
MNIPVFATMVILSLIAYVLIEVSQGAMSTKLTYSQLLTLAQNAGFTANEAETAAAIALAESGGDPRAYNPETEAGAPVGRGSYGLWQIYLNAHPEFTGQDLYDSPTNAAAAYKVFTDAGKSFTPWSSYKSAKFVQFMPGTAV